MQVLYDGPYYLARNLSNDCVECEHMITGKRIVVHKNRTKPATAPQQVWREAGKVDLNLPQPHFVKGGTDSGYSATCDDDVRSEKGKNNLSGTKNYGYSPPSHDDITGEVGSGQPRQNGYGYSPPSHDDITGEVGSGQPRQNGARLKNDDALTPTLNSHEGGLNDWRKVKDGRGRGQSLNES